MTKGLSFIHPHQQLGAPLPVGGRCRLICCRAERLLRQAMRSVPIAVDSSSKLDVVYEDDDFVAVNKPVGFHTAPIHRWQGGSVVNMLLAHLLSPASRPCQAVCAAPPGLRHQWTAVVWQTAGGCPWSGCSVQVGESRHLVFTAGALGGQCWTAWSSLAPPCSNCMQLTASAAVIVIVTVETSRHILSGSRLLNQVQRSFNSFL